MRSLYDYLLNGFIDEDGYNCAERILYGANSAYDMGLSKESLKLAAGFGGGMAMGYTCGVITAGVMVLSHLFVKDCAYESKYTKTLICELVQNVEAALTASDCERLKVLYRTETGKCKHIILEGARTLDGIVLRELKAI